VGENLNFSTLTKTCQELDELLLPYTFDLSILSHIKDDDMLDHIRRIGKVFYSSKTQTSG